MKANKTTLALAMTATIGMAGIAHAAGNPFEINALPQGYMMAAADKTQEGKCGEGKCGGAKDSKTKDAKAKDAKAKDAKAKDGKCGEGKCGGKK
ncbi:MAG: hypothetical protein GC183_03215 [Thiobacillus sp.]|nr:hypothetical protein [Thiobacillus sp.]